MNTHSSTMKRKRGWWIRGVILLVLLLVVAIWAVGAVAKANLMKQYPAPGQMMEVGSHRMHIYCVGQGNPTIILVAGMDDFSIIWSLVQPEIAETTRVCSYDRTGLGWSESSPDPPASEQMVEELHTLLVNAKVDEPYILVGHSFGGALVRLYAHHYSDEVMGMVLVDAAPDELFIRISTWQTLIEQKLRLFRILAPLSSAGMLALAPGSIPNRGLPDAAFAQYQAIAASTSYFQTGVAENAAFENNLAEIRAAHITSFGDMPLIVLSRGYWDAISLLSEAENRQAWQLWQEMQSELPALSTNSKQIIAERSEHAIQLQQPELVIDAILEMVDAIR